MENIVLDANVIYHLHHNKIDLIDKFIKFCEEKELSIVMAEDVFYECERGSRKILENKEIFSKVNVEKSEVDGIRDICESLYKPIHTKKDNDYKVLASALKVDADMIFTNDHDLVMSIKEYKKENDIPKKEMVLGKTPNLLWLMYKRKKGFFKWHENIGNTIKLHHHVELPNHINNFCKYIENDYLLSVREYERIKKDDKERYKKQVKERFNPYSRNIFNTMNGMKK